MKDMGNNMTELNQDVKVSINPANDVAPDVTIAELQNQVAELNDKYLRAAAEVENMRRRCELDAQNMARARAGRVAENFLPLIDAIDAGLKHAPDDAGILAMNSAANAALEKSGIVRIKTIGEPLNPMHHNAVSTVDANGVEPNIITDELQSGFMFGDNVLRTAMVIVAK